MHFLIENKRKVDKKLINICQNLGNTAQRLCGRCAVRFFVRLYKNDAGILSYGKEFLCKMTENLQADDVQRRQMAFVRCYLYFRGEQAMYRILVADDEPDVLSLLKDYFEINGYEVITAENGRAVLERIRKAPDIILLDINMPDMDGISVCKAIREYVSCPILFLTARIEDCDKIMGFASGGDDYIIKPFSIDELGARVMAHIRREHRDKAVSNVRFFGETSIDYSAKILAVNGEKTELAKKEFEIIELLSINAGQVFDKERIYEKIWGYDAEGNSSVVAEHIRRIRAKLAEEAYHIETVWGIGYKWVK